MSLEAVSVEVLNAAMPQARVANMGYEEKLTPTGSMYMACRDPRDLDRVSLLSPREYDVLLLLSTGATGKQIAKTLGITHSTVRDHANAIYSQDGLNVPDVAEAASFIPMTADKVPAVDSDTLNQRGKEVLALSATGKTAKEIAQELFLSESAVRSHKSYLYDRLGLDGISGRQNVALRRLVGAVANQQALDQALKEINSSGFQLRVSNLAQYASSLARQGAIKPLHASAVQTIKDPELLVKLAELGYAMPDSRAVDAAGLVAASLIGKPGSAGSVEELLFSPSTAGIARTIIQQEIQYVINNPVGAKKAEIA